MSGRYN